MRRFVLTIMILTLMGFQMMAQRVINGKVSDEEGADLPGVCVVIKGTQTGVITDANGEYKITINSDSDILVFSFIGMIPQEIKVKGKTKIDVVLKNDVAEMEEVVVVGYDKNILQSISGAVAGVAVKKRSGIRIRGRSSFVSYETNFNTERYASVTENGINKLAMSHYPHFRLMWIGPVIPMYVDT